MSPGRDPLAWQGEHLTNVSGRRLAFAVAARHNGTGADVLIHEVASVRPEIASEPAVARVMAHHTSPEEAGKVFTRAHPRLAVYTHFTLLSRPNVAPITLQELVDQTRETYIGPLEVGRDLMVIDVPGARVSKTPE